MADTPEHTPALSNPQELIQEIAKITQETQSNPRPSEPLHMPTTMERLEANGLNEHYAMDYPMTISLGLSFAASLVVGLVTTGVVGFAIFLAGVLFSFLVTLPFCTYLCTPGGGKFWARVVRKKHYLELHHKEKTQQQIAQKAYEQTLAKHAKVMKRLRKRAKPLIEAYNAKDPMKELVFSEHFGLVEEQRYTPGQKKALSIASTILEESADELVSTPGLKKLKA